MDLVKIIFKKFVNIEVLIISNTVEQYNETMKKEDCCFEPLTSKQFEALKRKENEIYK